MITGDEGHGLREITIPAGAPAVGKSLVSLGLPAGVLIVLLHRQGQSIVPQGGTVFEAGDRVLLLAEDDALVTTRGALVGGGGRDAL